MFSRATRLPPCTVFFAAVRRNPRPWPIPTARQENYYNDVPFGDMLFEENAGDEEEDFSGSLMDTSINNAVLEFGFPVEFFLDMLCRYGGISE